MKLFVIDTETTGLELDFCDTIEVAGCLYDTELKSEIATVQFLINCVESNPAQFINGISKELLQKANFNMTFYSMHLFNSLYNECDYIVAHNAAFDRKFLLKSKLIDDSKPWICSQQDLSFPKQKKSGVLIHISIDHNLAPSNVHRALGDVQTLCNLLKVVPDLEDQIRKSGSRLVFMPVSKSFSMNPQLKEHNFKFNGETKLWSRKMTPDEAGLLPFQVRSEK